MTTPEKVQLYLGDLADQLTRESIASGISISAVIRNRVKRSYEAEEIIRDLLLYADVLEDRLLLPRSIVNKKAEQFLHASQSAQKGNQ